MSERILFRESDHKYLFEKEGKSEQFTSVTTLLSGLSPKKDFDTIAKDYYIKFYENGSLEFMFKDIIKKNKISMAECYTLWGDLDYSNYKCVLKIWDDIKVKAATKGTAYHLLREKEAYTYGAKPLLEEGEFKIGYNLFELFGNYTELILYHPFYKVSGSADVVEISEDKSFNIRDYKGLSLDTPIPTISGFKNMIDIQKGDIIFDGNGELTKVKNISNIHYNPCYKIYFDTGDTIICDHEHRWVISEPNHYRKTMVDTEMTTEDLVVKFENKKTGLYIPCVSLKTTALDLPLDPYILGLWLGDGCKNNGTITCVNDDIWAEIENRGFKTSKNHNEKYDKAESRTIYGLRNKLNLLNLLDNKHIPDIYYRASFEQRLDLLRGFLDADGYFHRKRKRVVMNTTKEWQADSIMRLASTLGIKPIKINCTASGFGKTDITSYNICFTSSINPFLVRNKDYEDVVKDKNKFFSKYRSIIKVEKIETVPTKCIEVESETHCYLAGYNLIKTHNTNKKIPERKSFKGERLKSPVSHLLSCDYDKYNLQLSIYAFILEEYGYKCNELELLWIKDVEKDERVSIPVNYLKKEAKDILTYFKNNNYKI